MKKLQQYTINYTRDTSKNYMILNIKNHDFNEADYQLKMVLNNTIEGLLPLNLTAYNDEINLSYDITSKQTLEEMLLKKEIQYQQIKTLLQKMMDTIDASKKYLLKEDNMLFQKEFIYLNPSNLEPFFCYVPQLEETQPLMQQIKEIIEFLMTHVEREDKEGIYLIHNLYKKTREENFTLKDIKAIIKDKTTLKTPVEDSPSIQQKQEKDKKPLKSDYNFYHHDHTDKESVQKTPLKKEIIKEEKEVKIYPTHYKMVTAILQVLIFILLYLVVKQGVFIDETTQQLDITKFIGLFVILIAIDAYINMKMFQPKNKIVKIIEEEKTMMVNPTSHSSPFINLNKKTIDNTNIEKEIDEEAMPEISEIPYDKIEGTTLLSEAEEEMGTTLLNQTSISEQGVLINKNNEQRSIHTTPFIIGKLKDQVDYCINNPAISRLHCKIIQKNENYYLIDLNSRNGTYINGTVVNSQEEYLLNNEATIQLANEELEFKIK